MNYYRRSELTPTLPHPRPLRRYRPEVRGADYRHPIRMRDWELAGSSRPSARCPSAPASSTPAPSTPTCRWRSPPGLPADRLGPHLEADGQEPSAPGARAAKATEAPFFDVDGRLPRAGVPVRNLNLTRLACPDASFDCVVALSVIEHVPAWSGPGRDVPRARPGGRMLITTDCSPEPTPYAGRGPVFLGGRARGLFAPYPVTSRPQQPRLFAEENWCYGLGRPVVTAFVEITKPR
jgi:hypothetical protein